MNIAVALILAALSDDPACITHATVAAEAHEIDPGSTVISYDGFFARAFVAAIERRSVRPAPIDLAGLTHRVGIYINSDPKLLVLVLFFGADGCRIWGTQGGRAAVAGVISEMGQGI